MNELQKKDIFTLIEKSHYQSLRVSVFEDKNDNRQEYQARIEYDDFNDDYPVYFLMDRGSTGRFIDHYSDFETAKNAFFQLLDYIVSSNCKRVSNGKLPDYESCLWNKKC